MKAFRKKRGCEIQLILCKRTIPPDTMHSERAEEIRRELRQTLGISDEEIRYLDWEKHVFHMLLADSKLAIYFSRLAKSPTIVPVLLERAPDFRELDALFGRLYEDADGSPD